MISLIDRAAKAGFHAYFGHRAGHHWGTAPVPTVATWRMLAEQVLTGELVGGRAVYEWYIDIREAKGWTLIGAQGRARWEKVYSSIVAIQQQEAA